MNGLVATRALGLAYLAGSDAGGRIVTWAHACDLPDPWVWFKAGDLVMTTGGGLPSNVQEQVEWITKLIDAGVAGIVFALEPGAPAIGEQLLATAQDRHFPVLSASFDLPFVTLARTVIESAIESERSQLAQITRVYDAYWRSLHGRESLEDRLSALENSTGWALEIGGDLAKNRHYGSGRQYRRLILAEELSGVTEKSPEVVVAIAGSTPGLTLRATSWRRAVNDQPLLQHLAGLLSLELEHAAARLDQQRTAGRELLDDLLTGTLTLPAVWPELRRRGLTGDLVLAHWAVPVGEPLVPENVHRHPSLEGIEPLLVTRPNAVLAVLPAQRDLLRALSAELGPRCRVGHSRVLQPTTDIAEASRQARFAAAQALEGDLPVVGYGAEDVDADLFPRSLDDTRSLASRVLGPLAFHDLAHDGDLLTTLRVFLRHDGNWKRSAEELRIHRQTLVYRLRKVAELTGSTATSSRGSAMFWLAIEAADRAGLQSSDLVQSS